MTFRVAGLQDLAIFNRTRVALFWDGPAPKYQSPALVAIRAERISQKVKPLLATQESTTRASPRVWSPGVREESRRHKAAPWRPPESTSALAKSLFWAKLSAGD